jgi:hypothetical protein
VAIFEGMEKPSPDPVRSAHARLANARRWGHDAAAVKVAQRDLVVAQAAALAAEAARLLRGDEVGA